MNRRLMQRAKRTSLEELAQVELTLLENSMQTWKDDQTVSDGGKNIINFDLNDVSV